MGTSYHSCQNILTRKERKKVNFAWILPHLRWIFARMIIFGFFLGGGDGKVPPAPSVSYAYTPTHIIFIKLFKFVTWSLRGYRGADPGFTHGGGGAKECTSRARRAGVYIYRACFRAMESLGIYNYAISCYLSLNLKHSDTNRDKINSQHLGGGAAPSTSGITKSYLISKNWRGNWALTPLTATITYSHVELKTALIKLTFIRHLRYKRDVVYFIVEWMHLEAFWRGVASGGTRI